MVPFETYWKPGYGWVAPLIDMNRLDILQGAFGDVRSGHTPVV